MLPIYLFCAAFGIPLLALFAFGGGSSDAEVGGFEMDADIGDVGDIGSDFDLDMSPVAGSAMSRRSFGGFHSAHTRSSSVSSVASE